MFLPLFSPFFTVRRPFEQHLVSIRCNQNSSTSRGSPSKSCNGNFKEALSQIQKAIESLKMDDAMEAETRLKRTLAELSR
jgi:hypothetical protein